MTKLPVGDKTFDDVLRYLDIVHKCDRWIGCHYDAAVQCNNELSNCCEGRS